MALLRAGEKAHIGNGVIAEVSKVRRSIPIHEKNSKTAVHEGGHLLALAARGRRIDHATIVPGPGYGGYVAGDHDALSTVIPYAMGVGGAGAIDMPGSDLWQLHQQGYDPDALVPLARAFVNKHKVAYNALATALDEHKELSGGHARHVFNEAQNGGEVEIKIKSPEGAVVKRRMINVREDDDLVFPPIESSLGRIQ